MMDADNGEVLWEERNWMPFGAAINDITKRILRVMEP